MIEKSLQRYTGCMKNPQIEANSIAINPDTTVADMLRDWPQTISVFLMYHMDCPGCSMSSFERLSDAAQIYNVPVDQFFQNLSKAISSHE